jgi:hypothetical protein
MNYQAWAQKVDSIVQETKHPVNSPGGSEKMRMLSGCVAAQNRSGALSAVPHPCYLTNTVFISDHVTPLPGEDEADTFGRTFDALFDVWPENGEHPLFLLKMPFEGVPR